MHHAIALYPPLCSAFGLLPGSRWPGARAKRPRSRRRSAGVRPRPAQGDYGTIKGRLVWGGSEVPPAKDPVEKGKAAKDPEVCAKDAADPLARAGRRPQDQGRSPTASPTWSSPSGTNPEAVKELLAKSPKAELDQKNCEFFPYVQAIHQDQPLVIKSSDPVNHNVRYAAFTNPPFNQILAPNGQLEVKLVAERRPIAVACDIHSWMKAYSWSSTIPSSP